MDKATDKKPLSLADEDVSQKVSVNTSNSPNLKNVKRSRVYSRFKRRFLKHLWLARLLLVILIMGIGYGIFWGVKSLSDSSGLSHYITLASYFVTTPEDKIEQTDGHTNILILGKGGLGHEAPDLTDTMMILSVDHTNSTVSTVSLPRDIWIPELRAKLNSAYYWGNQKQQGGGLVLAKSSVEKVSGLSIHYGVVVDFKAFELLIDELGGIEVDVQTAFTDTQFPIAGKEDEICPFSETESNEYWCRYETIHFDEGRQYMDSQTALKFVRSRHAEGDEGTDFARSIRQQLVIEGIKEKFFSREILTSYSKIQSLIDIGMNNTETDLDASAISILARRFYDAKDSIQSHSIPEELLINPPISPQYDNLYVFIPNNPDENASEPWELFHGWIKCSINNDSNCTRYIPAEGD